MLLYITCIIGISEGKYSTIINKLVYYNYYNYILVKHIIITLQDIKNATSVSISKRIFDSDSNGIVIIKC